jgi:acyl-coenzyme A thioesterase PaaI-like protein
MARPDPGDRPVSNGPPTQHILSELGFAVSQSDRDLVGVASIIPEMHVPGSPHLRTSIMAAWADHLCGLLAVTVTAPLVPVTLELDVHLFAPAPDSGTVRCTARALKTGRSVFMANITFTSDDGNEIAVGGGSFMVAPDPSLRLPSSLSLNGPPPIQSLRVPLAQRAGCERREPGVAVLPRSDDGLNSSNTVNGGLIALAAEEAALSLAPGATLSSLSLRYLRPVRVGPAVATAATRSGLGQIEVRDAGNENRLSVIATARFFDC